MKKDKYEYFLWILMQLVKENPNDMDLGKRVREFVKELQNDN